MFTTPWLRPPSRLTLSLLVVCVLTWPMLSAGQIVFPRLGFSAAADAEVDSVVVAPLETFTLHVNLVGALPDEPLDQELSSISWIVLSVCCGANLEIHDYQFDPAFVSTGTPYTGVVSEPVGGCVDEDLLHFATLTVSLDIVDPGTYFVVAGPFENAVDCAGASPVLMDNPVRVIVQGEITPAEPLSWGTVKGMYR